MIRSLESVQVASCWGGSVTDSDAWEVAETVFKGRFGEELECIG